MPLTPGTEMLHVNTQLSLQTYSGLPVSTRREILNEPSFGQAFGSSLYVHLYSILYVVQGLNLLSPFRGQKRGLIKRGGGSQ
jgi:hypothetical protein